MRFVERVGTRMDQELARAAAMPPAWRQRLMARAVATVIVAALAAVTAGVAAGPAQARLVANIGPLSDPLADPLADASQAATHADGAELWDLPPDWTPPSWHPSPEALQAMVGMDGPPVRSGRPSLNARSAYAYDLDSGEVLLSYHADERWPVASLTKLVSGLAASTEDLDLDSVRCVDALWYPTRNGAFSKFSTGECYRGWDLLGSMLVASDNRAAYGTQVLSGLSYGDFIARMNTVARDLGMSQSEFSDPSGLEDDNLSTARDMARAVVAVGYHPVLSIPASARGWSVKRMDGPGSRELRSTNRLAARGDLQVLAAKTGYTDTARYCYTALVQTDEGRTIALSVIGANRSSQRWSDVDRILRWIAQG
jgi:D-alanyl-D-alanine endopeptidase (penicillin-binding protein 7)